MNAEPRYQQKVLHGAGLSCHVAWSRRSDGPMNLIGREFPDNSKEAGDNERLANRGYFLQHALNVHPVDTVVPKLAHGADVRYVTDHNETLEELQCDGVMTSEPHLALTVGFADCPSVLLFDTKASVISLVHAGWKGVAAGIIEEAVRKIVSFGSHPSNLKAFIGPSIRRCCYEVDPGVASQVDGLEHQGKVMLDLPDIITARLVVKGVPIEDIEVLDECTKCSVDKKTGKPLYFSYRREQKNDPLDTGMFVALLR